MAKEINLFNADLEVDTEEAVELDEGSFPVEQHVQQHIKRVIEALLFTSHDPLPLSKIREITHALSPLPPRQIRHIIEELQQDYISQHHAFTIEEIAQGYLLRTHEEYAPYIELLYRQKRGEKLTQAATEVLAIIAYRQPITRPQIDLIRDVDSSGIVIQLLERGLIESMGRSEGPGRPSLYKTTKEFLKHFGLKNLEELQQIFAKP